MTAETLVVLPTLGDRLDTLRLALDSVQVQRATAEVTLVVVVPPAASEARALAASAGAVIIDDPRTGLAGAMNAGLGARTHERFYVGLGDDDLLRPDAIRHLVEVFDASGDASVVYGACDYIDSSGTTITTSAAGPLAARILGWGPNLIPHPGALIALDHLVAVGGFDEGLPFTMDLDVFLKLRARGRLISTSATVSAFRWHPDSLTVSSRRASAHEALAVKRRHLPPALRAVSPLWLLPVAWATVAAGRVVNARAKRLGKRG